MLADDPRRHYALRGRGMSKTTDAAGVALALLLTRAPARSRSHAYAVDAGQARILLDTIGGLVGRSGLGGAVEVSARSVTVRATGASLAVEASDGASAYGLRPWLTVCDELGMWPATTNHRALWAAITSAVPKVPGSRLVAIGTAGSPASLGAKVWQDATASPYWRTSLRPGPAPWWTAEDVEATRADLTASEWRRLILCEWAEGDDALTTPEDVAACIRGGSLTLPPVPGVEYVAALDVGTRRDLTGLAVGHAERRASGRVVVIDRVLSWRPAEGTGGRVDLSEVESATLRLCREYRVRRLRFDRMQAEQLTGNLARAGVRPIEYVFSSAGADRLARSLFVALRDRAVELPDDDELRAEAMTVRLVETGPGTVKMSNPPGTHDDVLTAVGMVLADLTAQPDSGPGTIWSPIGRPAVVRTLHDARPTMPARLAVRQAAREQTRAQRRAGLGLIVPRSANDPARVQH
ncbi:hypothetical protein [Nocardioides sp. TF02-7]|uniref:hypothetical protein n=1 Tax=Nocardioides sp. TF02-7 TaxID=2917724 RepID=UPI001F06474B|nr:hypothetical protein [Nocardioides sp. TF02-7]UMG94159.1 hypothetical protein MF408_09045 [Nocardioides sp. TF02-7]